MFSESSLRANTSFCRVSIVLTLLVLCLTTILFVNPALLFGFPPAPPPHDSRIPRPTNIPTNFVQPAPTFPPVTDELKQALKEKMLARWHESGAGGESGIESLQHLLGLLAERPEIVKNYLINIDIGANVGQTTSRLLQEIVAKRSDFIMFSYEPMNEPMKTYSTLVERSNTENWTSSRFTVFNCAVGIKPGTATFYFDPRDLTSQQSSQDPKAVETTDNLNTTNVTIITMDQFMYESIPSSILRHGNDALVADTTGDRAFQKHDLYFFKIDTEGYDMDVLNGSEKILRNKRAKFVEFEYNFKWFTLDRNTTLRNVTTELYTKYGYECYFVSEKYLHPLFDRWWEDRYEIRSWSNVFCGVSGDPHLYWIVKRFDCHDFSDLAPIDYIELGLH